MNIAVQMKLYHSKHPYQGRLKAPAPAQDRTGRRRKDLRRKSSMRGATSGSIQAPAPQAALPDAPPKAPSFKTLVVRAPHAALTSANAALPLYGFQLPSRRTAQLIKHKSCKTLIKKAPADVSKRFLVD